MSALTLSACQGNPQNGLEPVNTGIRSSPLNSKMPNGPAASASDIRECHTYAATTTSGPNAALETRNNPEFDKSGVAGSDTAGGALTKNGEKAVATGAGAGTFSDPQNGADERHQFNREYHIAFQSCMQQQK